MSTEELVSEMARETVTQIGSMSELKTQVKNLQPVGYRCESHLVLADLQLEQASLTLHAQQKGGG